MGRAIGRTAAYELSLGAGSALAASAFGALVARGDRRTRTVVPALLTVGAAAALTPVLRQRAHARLAGGPAVVPSLAAAGAVAAGVQVVAAAEKGLSRAVGRGLAAVLPGPPSLWTWTGRAAAAAATAGLVAHALDGVYEKIESGAERAEAGLGEAPNDAYVSGGIVSAVPFGTLSREGRRHVLSRTRAQFIERVMGEVAVAEPVRVYVGLESAPTMEERVALALDEVERLGALDRSLLLLVSPTGTGYVNYAAIEAVEYLALGDVATVTMQYSLRPSFLSLDRVDEGREQNRALWTALHQRIETRRPAGPPARGHVRREPRRAHQPGHRAAPGHRGRRDLGVERALWIGSPAGSGWRTEIQSASATRETRALVGEFGQSPEDYLALPEERRAALRYVMITHDEDGVPKFGPPLAVQAPAWLRDQRPERDPGHHALGPIHDLPAGLRRHAQRLERDPGDVRRPRPRLPRGPARLRQRRVRPARHRHPDAQAAPGAAPLREAALRLHRRDGNRGGEGRTSGGRGASPSDP